MSCASTQDTRCSVCGETVHSEGRVPGSSNAECIKCLSKSVDRQIEQALLEPEDFYSCSSESEKEEETVENKNTNSKNKENLPTDDKTVISSTNNSFSGILCDNETETKTLNNVETTAAVCADKNNVNLKADDSANVSPSAAESENTECSEKITESVLEDVVNSTSSKEEHEVEGEIENDALPESEEESEEEKLKKLGENMTDEEKETRKNEATELKKQGNDLFREQKFGEAREIYSQALQMCPLCFARERAILYSNRAVCKMKMDDNEAAIADCSKAIELHPQYVKPLLRRAELYEKTEKLEEALEDYKKVIELDPAMHTARAACMRLPDQIKEKNEKMKEEMFGKLKDLGNMVLRPFGLSTDNFQLQQDPNSGSYSVQFQQKPK